jgi:hypothetical protein
MANVKETLMSSDELNVMRLPHLPPPHPASTVRRGVLAGLAGGLLAALPAAFVDGAAGKKGKRKKSTKKRKKTGKPALSGPAPVIRLDALCTGPAETIVGINGNARRGQVFTAQVSGLLVMAQLLLDQKAGADLDYDLRLSSVDSGGFPTNEILAQSAVAATAVPVGISLVTFTFSRPFAVVAGTRYALLLTRPGGGNIFWYMAVGDACPGNLAASANQTAEFITDTNLDYIFTTFVSS